MAQTSEQFDEVAQQHGGEAFVQDDGSYRREDRFRVVRTTLERGAHP